MTCTIVKELTCTNSSQKNEKKTRKKKTVKNLKKQLGRTIHDAAPPSLARLLSTTTCDPAFQRFKIKSWKYYKHGEVYLWLTAAKAISLLIKLFKAQLSLFTPKLCPSAVF